MKKQENRYIDSIHKQLPVDLDREKMHNPFRRGTFDCWYSAARDLWIEYKYLKIPAREGTEIELGLSDLQFEWGNRKHSQGRNVAVVVGCQDGGGIIFRMPDIKPNQSYKRGELLPMIVPKQDVVRWICEQTGVKFDPSTRSSRKRRNASV